jgi:acetyltransferase-like isoleucine patch superfamily enzyme
MRKITAAPVLTFVLLLSLILALATGTDCLLLGWLALGDFRGVVMALGWGLLVYLYAIAVYRVFLRYFPLREGEIAEHSREEFAYQVYLLFYLLLFYPLTRNHLLPTPLMRLLYQALGARLGDNSYSAGVIMDPPLTELGANSLIGHDAVLFSHALEGHHLSHARIRIGDNVTVGAKAIVMSGVTIGDGAMVAAGAVVAKGTRIAPGEVWGGNPARLIRSPGTPVE